MKVSNLQVRVSSSSLTTVPAIAGLLGAGLLLLSPSLCLAQAAEPELRQLRALLEAQQAVIENLQADQEKQRQEIDSLKARLAASPPAVHGVAHFSATGDDQASTAGATPTPVTQEHGTPSVVTKPEGLRVSVGGHVNRAINFADDGDSARTYFVDSGNVPTLAYLKAYKAVNDDLTFGAHIEYALQSNPATLAGQASPSAGFTTSGRFFEITADSKRYGKLWFGQGLSSTFALAELDQSGMFPYNMMSFGGAFGGLRFVNRETRELSEISVLQAFLDLEAINLISRVRYDTPAWNGFRLGGNIGEGNFGGLSLRWQGTAGDFDITAISTAQKNPQGGRIDERFDGGVGVLHRPSGFNLTLGGAIQEFRRDLAGSDPDSSGYTVRLGWRRQLNDLGETKIALDYQRASGITLEDDTAVSAGLFIAQEIRDWNAEMYAGYRYYDLERSDLQLHQIDGLTLGARFLFDATFEGSTAPR